MAEGIEHWAPADWRLAHFPLTAAGSERLDTDAMVKTCGSISGRHPLKTQRRCARRCTARTF